MIEIIYSFINLSVSIVVWILVYYYCFKIYGIKTTLITNLLISSFVLIQIFTGIYSIADLGGQSFLNIKIGNIEFLITDPISIFPLFMITFELGRISLRKTKGDDLLFKDIVQISLVVSFFGFCFQPIIDFTAAAVGFYYYRTPPELNIFGFPIIFLFAFSIYGLFAFIFLLIESHYKKMNQEIN